MTENVLELIGYHAGRAIEELELAEATEIKLARGSHMELSRLHLCQAGRLRASGSVTTLSHVSQWVLDMGEASREQGFREFGCR